MEHNPNNDDSVVSRREALKAIIAAGGMTAISALPTQWETPLIEAGALPAFAQLSVIPTPTPIATATPTPHPFTIQIVSVTFVGPNSNLMGWQSVPGWITIYRTPATPPPPPCGRRPFPGTVPCPWLEEVTVTIVIQFVPLPGFGPSELPVPGTPLSVIVIDDSKTPILTCNPVPAGPILVSATQTITVVFRIPDPCTCTWFHISLAFQQQIITLINGNQIPSADCVGPGVFGGETAVLC